MKYHLIGDLGVSMNAIRYILERSGNVVTGSDMKSGGHNPKYITDDIDLVVRSSAVTPGSPGWAEVLEAKKRGIRVLKRSELLDQLTADKFLIAVSGMHGKTTITALIGLTLIEAGLDPTVLVGEKLKEFGNQAVRIGKSKYFVLEACEYDRSFLDLAPDVAVLTNIDLEHLDTYPGGMNEIKEAFGNFISKIKKDGMLIIYGKDKNLIDIAKTARSDIKIIHYGEENDGSVDKNKIALIGQHNRLNAEAIFALADNLKIDKKYVFKVLADFRGAKRRLEYKGEFSQMPIYDDYGHHPTEISATVAALKEKYPGKKIIMVFWPHQYKRILPLKKHFIKALSMADEIILKPIYLVPGRDTNLDITSEELADKLQKLGRKSLVIDNDNKIVEYLKNNSDKSKIILTIGIPPIYKVADLLLKEVK